MKPGGRKIYCRSCNKLVRVEEKTLENRNIQIACSICKKPLYVWNGTIWNNARQVA